MTLEHLRVKVLEYRNLLKIEESHNNKAKLRADLSAQFTRMGQEGSGHFRL